MDELSPQGGIGRDNIGNIDTDNGPLCLNILLYARGGSVFGVSVGLVSWFCIL